MKKQSVSYVKQVVSTLETDCFSISCDSETNWISVNRTYLKLVFCIKKLKTCIDDDEYVGSIHG